MDSKTLRITVLETVQVEKEIDIMFDGDEITGDEVLDLLNNLAADGVAFTGGSLVEEAAREVSSETHLKIGEVETVGENRFVEVIDSREL